MNPHKHLIIANGQNITDDVAFCQYNPRTRKYDIRFKTGQVYSYRYNSVTWLKEPKVLDPSNLRIEYTNKAMVGISKVFVFGIIRTGTFVLRMAVSEIMMQVHLEFPFPF